MKGLLNNQFSKNIRATRKQRKQLENLGYIEYELDWKLIRGDYTDKIITDIKISHDGKYVYALLADIKK